MAVALVETTIAPLRVETDAADRVVVAVDFDTASQTAAAPHSLATEAAIRLQGWLQQPVAAVSLVDIPTRQVGTAFQAAVWEQLRAIRCGERVSYATIAQRCGRPRAARAVGAACGRNRLCLLVPCHRVVAADGSLGGFRWGLAIKERLLAAEQKTTARV